jgi:hypothetical protein|tara:strand:+ start:506 stop:997 length:492 start_codon:yes stop_codon:yes gene_type:complete
MATETYIPLATVTLATSSSAVYFDSISQDYSDLVLVFECEGSNSNRINGNLNGDTGANYSMVSMENDGGSTVSDSGSGSAYFHAGVCRDTSRSINIVNIMGYSDTDKHTSILSRENAPTARLGARAMRWANTAAVTSVAVSCSNGTFDSGSTFKLFGIHGEVV